MTLASLLYDPPYSLVCQSWAPRQQHWGTVNADGYGVGWYQPDIRPEPARLRRAGPIWADRSLESLAGLVRSPAIMAAVRSATPPAPAEESGAAPFSEGRWLFSLNGRVEGDLVALRRRVTPRRQAAMLGSCDAEVLFALLLDRLDSGCPTVEAVTGLLAEVPGRLNLLLTDGTALCATAWGDTLWWRSGSPGSDGSGGSGGLGAGIVVASEPLDDLGGWVAVPDRSLLSVSRGDAVPDIRSPSGSVPPPPPPPPLPPPPLPPQPRPNAKAATPAVTQGARTP